MPAAAVRREEQALFIVTWRIGYHGGVAQVIRKSLQAMEDSYNYVSSKTWVNIGSGYVKRSNEMLKDLIERQLRRLLSRYN